MVIDSDIFKSNYFPHTFVPKTGTGLPEIPVSSYCIRRRVDWGEKQRV